MVARMKSFISPWSRALGCLLGALSLGVGLRAQEAAPVPVPLYDADTAALHLARQYLEGGAEARPAVLQALQRMGWGVRNARGDLITAPPAGTDTGLAMRDYELEELLWRPAEQPSLRLISFAQALAVPMKDADPEELAQELVEALRREADSAQPQRRFWARFIIALGRVGPAGYDLTQPAPPAVIPPSRAMLREIERSAQGNPFAAVAAMQPKPLWAADDPVLAPSARPEGAPESGRPERDQQRMQEISAEMGRLADGLMKASPAEQQALQERMNRLSQEMTLVAQRQMAGTMGRQAAALRGDGGGESDDEEAEEGASADGRFLAEWRDQPLSLMQVALITRVLSADLRRPATPVRTALLRWLRPLPLAQAAGPSVSFGDQFSGAAGDIWATTSGAVFGQVMDKIMPDSTLGGRIAIANTIIAWFKTIMSVARQKITIEVENAPLVRTKTRSPGQQRTARCKVEIDFPKDDVLKAIRAAANVTTLDLQLPDGGPVSGGRVVWRLPEGSYNGKYQTAKGGWEYRPELAVVQFAQAGGKAAYVSTTNENGEATITIEGVPQRRTLPSTVRPYPRRAAVGVEVTIKVGNLTQDLNDAINTAMGGPIGGGLSFIADMILRTSFFFQKSEPFEVTDWKEPAWEGEFEITIKGAGSKDQPALKGGPPTHFEWRLDRYMEGRLHTPDWAEADEEKRAEETDGRHALEVDGDSRYFRLRDSSSARTPKSLNRYEANGPLQVQPAGQNRLATYSRAEPSGSATLTFTGGKMILDLAPFFGAECLVARAEQSGGRSSSKSGPEYLSLLAGVAPESFSIVDDKDGTEDVIEGTKTITGSGNLPYVPGFEVEITVKYRLWKNIPPPRNKAR